LRIYFNRYETVWRRFDLANVTAKPGLYVRFGSKQTCALQKGMSALPPIATWPRATVRQRKTGRPVRFELTEHTRQAIDAYLKSSRKKPGEFLFTGPGSGRSLTPRQYGRIMRSWLMGIGLDPHLYGTHSLRRTKATLIYRWTGNLRAVQLLLGHTKIEITVRYLA
jgi:integrase